MVSFADLKKIFDARNVILLEYLRKSRADNEFETVEQVLERHESILRDFLMKNFEIEVPEENIYKEVISGGETIDERAEMKKVIARIEKGDVFALIVVEPQRLTRGDNMDIGLIERTLLYTNTLCITPSKVYDLSDPFDKKLFRMELQQGSEYLEYFKVISARGRQRSFEEGLYLPAKAPLGYDKVKLHRGYTIKPNDDAQIVKDMFDYFIETKSLYRTGVFLEQYFHKRMDTRVVRDYLSNKTYAGYNVWGKTKEVKSVENGKLIAKRVECDDYKEVKGIHEPLISLKTFETAQEILAVCQPKTRKQYALKNSLAGVIHCGICGGWMERAYNSNGIPTLRCSNSRTGCINVSAHQHLIEDRVFTALADELDAENKYLENYEQEIVKKKRDVKKEIDRIDKQYKKLSQNLEKICEFYECGDYTRDLYIKRSSAITEEQKALTDQKKALLKELDNDDAEIIRKRIPLLKKCLNDYKQITPEEQNNLLKTIIKDIKYFKYVEGRRKPQNMDKFTLEITFLP